MPGDKQLRKMMVLNLGCIGNELKPRQKENIYRMKNTQESNTEVMQCSAGAEVGEKYKSNMIHNAVCDSGVKGWKLKSQPC